LEIIWDLMIGIWNFTNGVGNPFVMG
jgi:hypothetical protein